MKTSVSMICAPQNNKEVAEYLSIKADYLHFDLMDGTMSDCKGMSWESIDYLIGSDYTKCEMHIISKNPSPYIDRCISTQCGCIVFHVESDTNICDEIQRIKSSGIRVGLAISVDTLLDVVFPFLDQIDLVVVMTVKLGSPGQSFQKKELNKVIQLKEIRNKKKYKYLVEVDGSCNEKNFPDIYNSGTDVCVLGKSGLFSLASDIRLAWERMEQYMKVNTTVYIHADHVGSQLIGHVYEWLTNRGYAVVNLYTDGKDEYPECARQLSSCVLKSKYNYGILCCGTGIGMSIVANRISGIRAAVVSDVYSAKMSREHNDANVLCLGSRVVTKEIASMIMDAFFATTFLFGKHSPRVERYDN